jgi:hypothetical protein
MLELGHINLAVVLGLFYTVPENRCPYFQRNISLPASRLIGCDESHANLQA